MSGFTRDSKKYGDRLVYEALWSKWSRYHARCNCGDEWIAHAEPAGFTVHRDARGFVVLTGPGLTEDVDESTLTTNALWEAVTGEPGAQDWYEPVKVIDRSEKAEAERKAANVLAYGAKRERSKAAKAEPATEAQLRFLSSLVAGVSKDQFDAEFATAIKGTSITPRGPREKPIQAVKRLTKAAARKLITGLRT